MSYPFPKITAEEAAEFIRHDHHIGFSGFTPAGAAKAVPMAIAQRAMREHEAGRDFKVGVLTGASTGASIDGELAKANAVKFRTPYQSNPDMRKSINEGHTRFFDMHLSQIQQYVRYGFLGNIDFAVVEAADVAADGKVLLTSSVGASPTYLTKADKVIIELNSFHPKQLLGFHDIYEPRDPPYRRPIPICHAEDRIGSQRVWVDPKKIVGVVETNLPDENGGFTPASDITRKIGENVAEFLAAEMASGRVPKSFLPIQSGVGNVANAVLGAMGAHPDIPVFQLYTEVIQDSVIEGMKAGNIGFASGSSLTLSPEVLLEVYARLGEYQGKLLLRPQEISNSPEIARRLGIISINTALETDIFGNVNSTHVLGHKMMNGIGGSGDFTRNAYISIFTCPSTAKGGSISAIVPLCSHMDHSEHSVQVLITEHGIADLRGKSPEERAHCIITNCADPEYRGLLNAYYNSAKSGHTHQSLDSAFAFHKAFMETGNMQDATI